MPSLFYSPGQIPILDTERLTLRGHRPDDFETCAAMWADPAITRYIGGRPFSAEEVWARLLRYVGHWSCMGYGHWAIEEKATSRFVGELGFADFRRDLEPPFDDSPEIGWVLVSTSQGKGYATEAVRAAVKWGDVQFSTARTVCLIHPENLTSIRVAHKCGYREYQRTAYKCQPAILLERNSSTTA